MARLALALLGWCSLATAAAGQETMISIEGTVPAGPETHFFLPFEVPEGVAEIEVRHDDLSEENILDWGLDDPEGEVWEDEPDPDLDTVHGDMWEPSLTASSLTALIPRQPTSTLHPRPAAEPQQPLLRKHTRGSNSLRQRQQGTESKSKNCVH